MDLDDLLVVDLERQEGLVDLGDPERLLVKVPVDALELRSGELWEHVDGVELTALDREDSLSVLFEQMLLSFRAEKAHFSTKSR